MSQHPEVFSGGVFASPRRNNSERIEERRNNLERIEELLLQQFILDPQRESIPSEVQLQKDFVGRIRKPIAPDRLTEKDLKIGRDLVMRLLVKRFGKKFVEENPGVLNLFTPFEMRGITEGAVRRVPRPPKDREI